MLSSWQSRLIIHHRWVLDWYPRICSEKHCQRDPKGQPGSESQEEPNEADFSSSPQSCSLKGGSCSPEVLLSLLFCSLETRPGGAGQSTHPPLPQVLTAAEAGGKRWPPSRASPKLSWSIDSNRQEASCFPSAQGTLPRQALCTAALKAEVSMNTTGHLNRLRAHELP